MQIASVRASSGSLAAVPCVTRRVGNIAVWPPEVVIRERATRWATGFDRQPLSASRAVTPPCRPVRQSGSQSLASLYNSKCFATARRQPAADNIEISQAITVRHAVTPCTLPHSAPTAMETEFPHYCRLRC